ncbi:MAG: ATP-dependent chaperone ClpB, partial [Acidobacteria bacterium]|nr:ATP-dependent chaperone ClpB [Acidobacteriota bacterium]
RLRQRFRHEMLNRLEDIIMFHPLEREHLEKIVNIQFQRLRRLLADRGIDAELSPAARAHLAAVGFDPVYGARPLKRVLSKQVADPLALEILGGRVASGQSVLVDVEGGKLVFRPREAVGEGANGATVVQSRTA